MRAVLAGLRCAFLGLVLTGVAFASGVHQPTAPGVNANPPQVSYSCLRPRFTISPTIGPANTPVTISNGNGCPFPPIQPARLKCAIMGNSACSGWIAVVTFGGTPVSATVQSNGTILAMAPSPGPNDASVPVAVTLNNGTIIGGGSTVFSFPVADMGMTGPLPMNPSPVGESDVQWENGANHYLQIETPNTPPNNTLTFGIAAPVFHISIAFSDSGKTELVNNTNAQVIGNQGNYSATLQVCNIAVNTQEQAGTQYPDPLRSVSLEPLNPVGFNPAAPCTNWDTNQGYWIDVVNQQATLSDPGVDARGNPQTARGDIALPAASAFNPATYDFAHTFRIVLSLAEVDSVRGKMANRNDVFYGQPFTAVLLPTAMVQLKALPFTIVFSAPGNLSSVGFQTTNAFGTNYSLGNSAQLSNTYQEKVSKSTEYSVKFAGPGGQYGSSSASTKSSYDTTTSEAYGALTGAISTGMSTQQAQVGMTLTTNPATIPGAGQTCASSTDCSTQDLVTAPNWFMNQPFWNDTFQLLVHPQFAAFVLGTGQDRYVYWGADPVLASIQVNQLAACGSNQNVAETDPCQIAYAYSSLNNQQQYVAINATLALTADEANNLLRLDPFYVAGTQNAPLSAARAVPFPGPQVSFGTKFAPCPAGQTCTPAAPVSITSSLTNTQVNGAGVNGQQTYTNTITDVLGNTNTIGQTLDMATLLGSLTLGITVTSGDETTTTTQSQTIYNNSTAVSSTLATMETVTLSDCDSSSQGKCVPSPHAPLPQLPDALIYLDKTYGGFMFVDPNAPPPLPPGTRANLINSFIASDWLTLATNGEESIQRFPDVARGLQQQGAIGVLARTGILPGMPDGKFYPQSVLSRAQLASAMAKYLRLSQVATLPTYSDVSPKDAYAPSVAAAVKAGIVTPSSATRFGPNDAVSRQEMATSLAKAFGLTNKAIGRRARVAVPKLSDVSGITPVAAASVRAVVGAGYMGVFADNTFRPSVSVTRADAAQQLYAAIKDNLK
jgi:hypothetical protein